MNRTAFLTSVGVLGCVVGGVALLFPGVVLVGKGVSVTPATVVWVRQVGVQICALSIANLLARRALDSLALRALLWCNAMVHAGLFPIEIVAWSQGTITRLDAIVPNSALHVVCAVGFTAFARRSRAATAE